MPLETKFQIDDREVSLALARLRMALPLSGDMTPAMQSMGRVLKTAAQLRFRETRSPDGTEWKRSGRAEHEGGQTLSLSRRLRNSITYSADRISATVGTNVVYAAIHQFGGIVRAKKGPFLAIPVTAAAREAGSPRRFPGLHVWQTLKGQFVMGTDKGVVHFVLKRQVTIPARPFLGASVDDRAELVRVLQQHLEGIWRRR
jgi:phage virion morphogenesis protein